MQHRSHFFWNEKLNNKVLEAGVLNLPDKLSDHSPIYCKIDSDCAEEQKEQTPMNSSYRTSKVNWENLTQGQKDGINRKIEKRMLNIPSCIKEWRNVHCQDKEHNEAIDLHIYTLLGNISDCYHKPPVAKTSVFPDGMMKLNLSVNRLCSGILYGRLHVNL